MSLVYSSGADLTDKPICFTIIFKAKATTTGILGYFRVCKEELLAQSTKQMRSALTAVLLMLQMRTLGN